MSTPHVLPHQRTILNPMADGTMSTWWVSRSWDAVQTVLRQRAVGRAVVPVPKPRMGWDRPSLTGEEGKDRQTEREMKEGRDK